MVRVLMYGMMVPSTLANGLKTRSTVEDSMNGLMAECTMESGKTTICMEEESIPGRMVVNMRVNTTTIANMDLAFTLGRMEDSMLVLGKMANSMEKEHIECKMVKRRKDYGKTERGLSGWMNELIFRT